MHMNAKYTLFRRGGIYYSQDSATGQQKSLRTRDETEALKLINARNEGGPFESIWDFTERVDPMVSNKRVLEALAGKGQARMYLERGGRILYTDFSIR